MWRRRLISKKKRGCCFGWWTPFRPIGIAIRSCEDIPAILIVFGNDLIISATKKWKDILDENSYFLRLQLILCSSEHSLSGHSLHSRNQLLCRTSKKFVIAYRKGNAGNGVSLLKEDVTKRVSAVVGSGAIRFVLHQQWVLFAQASICYSSWAQSCASTTETLRLGVISCCYM